MKYAKVKTLSVARLYNLGNYEHVRYEVTVEIPDGVTTKQTLADIVGCLKIMKPTKKPFGLDEHRAILMKPLETLSETEKLHLEEWRQEVSDWDHAQAMKCAALDKFEKLGGVSKKTDAKHDWQDEEDGIIF
jgi:hypothetical protein